MLEATSPVAKLECWSFCLVSLKLHHIKMEKISMLPVIGWIRESRRYRYLAWFFGTGNFYQRPRIQTDMIFPTFSEYIGKRNCERCIAISLQIFSAFCSICWACRTHMLKKSIYKNNTYSTHPIKEKVPNYIWIPSLCILWLFYDWYSEVVPLPAPLWTV